MTTSPAVHLFEDDDALAQEIVLACAAEDLLVARLPSREAVLACEGGVLVMDRLVDGRDSLDLIEALRGRGARIPVIVISSLASVDERIRGLKAGGDDYLVKPFAMGELVARVEAQRRRATDDRRTRLTAGPLEMDLIARTVRRGLREIPLLPREFGLLEYLMRRAGSVVTRAMLLEEVWNYRSAVQTNVVDVHVGNLRRKIDGDGEPRLIVSVRGLGFKLVAHGTKTESTSFLRRLVGSSAFRIAVAFAFALTATTYGVFALVYLQFYRSNVALATGVLEQEVRGSLDTTLDRLEVRLRLRLTEDIRHLDYVGLFDAGGKLLFGNVVPGLDIPRDGKAHTLRLPPPQPEATGPADAIVVAAERSDGDVLVLGRSLAAVDELAGAMLRAFAIAIVPVVLIALALGALVSVRASRRLTTIQDAIRRVMGGDLHVRLPARGTPDDVDELVRAVNAMLDEIVRLLAQLKSVGDNIAHDLRAPLAVMRARLERGLAGSSETELRRLTGKALGDLERAMTTVTALLRISELESGLRRSAFDEVDLRLVAQDAYELYAPLAEAKGLAITLAAETPVLVHGDGDLLREALINLVDNAVKFTPAGGAVHVTSGEGTLLRVADTGPGVALEERDRISKRFYRAAWTRDTPGHGLGLSMTTTIAELHGFLLRVRDNHPGAIFEIVAGSDRDAPAQQVVRVRGRPGARRSAFDSPHELD